MVSLNRPFLPPSLEDSVADTAVGWWIVWRLCCIMCYTMLYYVILCYTMLYYVILCYTMFYYVILCYILCYTVYYPIIFKGFSYSVIWESAESEKPAPSRRAISLFLSWCGSRIRLDRSFYMRGSNVGGFHVTSCRWNEKDYVERRDSID